MITAARTRIRFLCRSMTVVGSVGAIVGANGGVDRGAMRSRIRHLSDGVVQAWRRSLHLCWAQVSSAGVSASERRQGVVVAVVVEVVDDRRVD